MTRLTVGSTFTGVGGIDLAFERTGHFETTWTSEVEPHASAVLAYQWPELDHLGDIHAIRTVPRTDLIVGGFPCQDYSVAGNRSGLAGDRGALWWQLHRLIGDVRPTWFVGENVPGLLTSNAGRDFRTIIESLGELGYGICWAVLDSQWFGVPQRRRRVVIVGHSGGRPRPEVLAVGQGLSGDSPPSRETGEDVAGGADGCAVSSSGRDITGTVTTTWAKGPGNTQVEEGALVSFVQAVMVAENQRGELRTTPTASLNTGGGKPGQGYPAVMYGPTVRRLTPLECERLQGFPDNWTSHGTYGTDLLIPDTRPIADTHRYRMMGNAVTVPVFQWVAERIARYR